MAGARITLDPDARSRALEHTLQSVTGSGARILARRDRRRAARTTGHQINRWRVYTRRRHFEHILRLEHCGEQSTVTAAAPHHSKTSSRRLGKAKDVRGTLPSISPSAARPILGQCSAIANVRQPPRAVARLFGVFFYSSEFCIISAVRHQYHEEGHHGHMHQHVATAE